MKFYDAPIKSEEIKRPTATVVSSPTVAYQVIPKKICNNYKEHFFVIYLNARGEIVHKETVSVGTATQSLVHPREVFYPAIKRHAVAIIVVHNHPSGNVSPSQEDIATTERLLNAGKILGIPVEDHLIVSGSSYFSFKERGLLTSLS